MKAIIFGATGSIGNYVFSEFSKDDIEVIGTTTNVDKVYEKIILVKNDNLENLEKFLRNATKFSCSSALRLRVAPIYNLMNRSECNFYSLTFRIFFSSSSSI
jgi:acetamidase/formamidase